jgi:2-hydroxy-3-keto-5-methylthiopentenyl-1-phosphate phosphatase
MTKALVTDFDGTMTRNDFYMLVLQRAQPKGAERYWQEFLRGERTHFDAMRETYMSVGPDMGQLEMLTRAMEPDPGITGAVRALQGDGWEVVIASAGCDWYIERILAELGITPTLHASPGRYDPERGLVMELPHDSPFLSKETGIDKEAVLRDALGKHQIVAFAGDGRPDIGPALMVPPERRYARGWLAERLRERGEHFVPFATWSDIASRLISGETGV